MSGGGIRFLDSYLLLPSSLKQLSKLVLSDEKGECLIGKGGVRRSEVTEKDHEDCIRYIEKDTRLLSSILMKANDEIYRAFDCKITDYLTLSSLSFSIFRTRYLKEGSIEIPSRGRDSYIRNSYFGGVTQVFRPYGENLYYYDINSLYPSSMHENDMPSGKGVAMPGTHISMDDFFGFICFAIF